MTQENCGYKCIQEERIRQLESNQAETRVYVKEIKEDIKEIKSELKSNPTNKEWSPIVMELIKLVTVCVTILGAIIGAAKMLGK